MNIVWLIAAVISTAVGVAGVADSDKDWDSRGARVFAVTLSFGFALVCAYLAVRS